MRVSNEWMKLGARGLTVLVASGDDGVGCNDWCTSFEFPYPSSPWITLVGATQVHQNSGKQHTHTRHTHTHTPASWFSLGLFLVTMDRRLQRDRQHLQHWRILQRLWHSLVVRASAVVSRRVVSRVVLTFLVHA